jgi:hypothetical protein
LNPWPGGGHDLLPSLRARDDPNAENTINAALRHLSYRGEEHPLSARRRQINRLPSATRARGEHAFHVVKRLWGFT